MRTALSVRSGCLMLLAACGLGCAPSRDVPLSGAQSFAAAAGVVLKLGHEHARPRSAPTAIDFRYRWNWRDYPIERFRDVPPDVQQVLQRFAKENSLCRGGSGAFRSTYRGCNRRDLISLQLQKLGWCWGSERPLQIERWLRCTEDRGFQRLGPHRSFGEPYSDEFIADLIEDEPISLRR